MIQFEREIYGQYAVRYWLSDFAKDSPTSSEVRTRIYMALKRAGISLTNPAQRTFSPSRLLARISSATAR